jgi:hypothetical protein
MGPEPIRMRTHDASRERPVSEVVQDIERTRNDLGVYFAEIDRRRHDALDWRLQLSRHRIAVTLVGAGAAAVVGLAVAAFLRRRK